MIRVIFRKAQNKIQDPAKLRGTVVELIDGETWIRLDIDIKGEIYEGCWKRTPRIAKSGAGQYFTPRWLDRGYRGCDAPRARHDDLWDGSGRVERAL